MSPSAAQAAPSPQPISAQPNPSRPVRKMSTSQHPLRLPSYSRGGASPMSFGAAMSGVSFTNGGGGYSYGRNNQDAPGSYGARFYGEGSDSTQIPFSTSVTMDFGSFAASGSAFGLPGTSYRGGFPGSYTGRSYAAAVAGRDFSTAGLSTSLASLSGLGSMGRSYSRGQIHDMMSMRSDAELTKEYECCGIKHTGLHALLEHVEDQHPYGVEQTDKSANNSAQNAVDLGFSPMMAMDLELEPETDAPAPSGTNSSRSTTSPCPVPNYPLTPTTANGTASVRPDALTSAKNKGFALSFSDMLKSPPGENEVTLPKLLPSTTSSSPDNLTTPTGSAHPSPPYAAPKITAASRSAFMSEPARSGNQRLERAFNEVVSGKPGATEDSTKPPGPTAVAPGVLFTAAAAMGIPPAPPLGRQNGREGTVNPAATANAAPAAGGAATPGEEKKDANGKDVATPTAGERPKPAEPHLPPPSLFTTHKAWRCPNPGCNKAYKQSNGLKYHLQKGQCDFAIHDAIDHGLTLEEAEERSRPYVCAVGAGCTKRYRQMNGLKYHYLNSGEHGQYGLRMLQNGTHPHPPSLPPPPKRDRPAQSHAARANAAPYAVPSHRPAAATTTTAATPATATGPRMGTWPTKPTQPAAGVQRTTTTTAPNAAAAAARPAVAAAAPKMAPVQRGRDAVLFANTDPLDV